MYIYIYICIHMYNIEPLHIRVANAQVGVHLELRTDGLLLLCVYICMYVYVLYVCMYVCVYVCICI